jgi:hypothetical protein
MPDYETAHSDHGDQAVGAPYQVPRIISVGRLVAFKGFEHLIDACAELMRRGFDFVCDILGDGPLRETLQTKINSLNLSSRVTLLGSLSQRAVLEKIQAADIFALASVIDAQGASDVFPTVILEAMACARAVVSTRLAGIPELVMDGETGVLLSPGDTAALTNALQRLLCDRDLRLRYGRAGRARIEQHFQIEDTVAPLLKLFERTSAESAKSNQSRASRPPSAATSTQGMARTEASARVVYLIDRWPDNDLPLLERELEEMKRRNVPILPCVCELNSSVRLDGTMQQIALSLEFLPDAMAIEAEWRTNRVQAQTLEEERAQQRNRVPAAVFLRQARFALALQRFLREKDVSHAHATSSRALVCALMLKKLLNVTVSATIEARPELPRAWIEEALSKCVGGRVTQRKLLDAQKGSFVLDKTSSLQLIGRAKFWKEWADLLLRWSCSDRKSKIENQK